MIQRLYISNFALIDKLHFQPNAGFNVITGETGAGKSIILGALGLLLGKRSDGTDLYHPEQKCVLEGEFNSSIKSVNEFLLKNDFDSGNELILRREILPSGKSRAFINDTPATLAQMKEVGALLVDIHSQNGHLQLKDPAYQLALIDSFAKNEKLVASFSHLCRTFKSLQNQIDKLKQDQAKLELDRDYFEFLYQELVELNPQEGELKELEEELGKLQHAEEIKSGVNQAQSALGDEGAAIVSNLIQVEGILSDLSNYSSQLDELAQRFRQSRIELEDIRAELDGFELAADFDPEKIEEYTERLNAYNNLLHKHRLTTDQELIEKLHELEGKVTCVSNLAGEISALEQKAGELAAEMKTEGEKISSARKKVIPALQSQIELILKNLGIYEAQIQFEISTGDVPNSMGFDSVKLLFSANKGKPVQELLKVASGGELSRVMLAAKSILADRTALPSIIFDEIDTGVSGEIANQMAEIMKKMSGKMQVISITHLPQVAAKGAEHFVVSKSSSGDRSETQLLKINGEERVLELAKMLSGEKVSGVAKENARMLLKN